MQQKANLIVTEVKTVWKFCKDVRVHTMEIINYEEKEMILLTIEENEYYEMQKFYHMCKQKKIYH